MQASNTGAGNSVNTELPAATAAADNMANPTAPQVLSHGMVFDGATWDRETQPLTDTQLRATAVPVSGPLTDTQLRASAVPVSQAAPSNDASTVLEDDRVSKAAAGTLYRVTFFNNNAATRYLQIFNAAAAPADGAVPTIPPIPVLTGQVVQIDFGSQGRAMSTGIYVCGSTTAATKTIGGNDFLFDVQYT